MEKKDEDASKFGDELKEEKEKCEFYKMIREKTSNII